MSKPSIGARWKRLSRRLPWPRNRSKGAAGVKQAALEANLEKARKEDKRKAAEKKQREEANLQRFLSTKPPPKKAIETSKAISFGASKANKAFFTLTFPARILGISPIKKKATYAAAIRAKPVKHPLPSFSRLECLVP